VFLFAFEIEKVRKLKKKIEREISMEIQCLLLYFSVSSIANERK
jgi:hypothetical protein